MFWWPSLARIRHYQPPQQTLLHKHDEPLDNPAGSVSWAHAHLDIPQQGLNTATRLLHVLPYETKMYPEAKTWLREHFDAEIRQIKQLLHWNYSDWRET